MLKTISPIFNTNCFLNSKCAEIYYEKSTTFMINCMFCNLRISEFHDFISHFQNLHLTSNNEISEDVGNPKNLKTELQTDLIGNQAKNISSTIQEDSEVSERDKDEIIENIKEEPFTSRLSENKTDADTCKIIEENKSEGVVIPACDICGRIFQHTRALRCHKTITHFNGKPKRNQEECSIVLEERPLKNRKITINTSWACSHCGKNLSTPRALRLHERRHTGNRSHKCDHHDCDKSFYTAYELRMHKHVHTDVRHVICEICGRSVRTESDLRLHKRIHTGEKPYSCETCGKRFKTCSDLKEHISMHSNLRPHICAVCGATFSRVKALNQHKNLHSKIKKFVCRLCGNAFAQAAGLSGHMKKHEILTN